MTQPLPGDIFNVGVVLNNTYEIDRILGRGGTGEVYRARNRITERLVAIKALNRQFSGNADYIELMKREEEMRAIQHDAVVRYTECSLSDDGHVFLVMDYVEGPPLSEVMARRRMDPRELLIIGHRVAEGLVATHGKGIIHRDLSPDNIILRQGDPGKATIIDFGIAKDTAVGARTIVGSDFAGKYEYSAPEQLDGHVSPKSDLYALGATLLAAWRGETPFSGATPGEIIRRKQNPLDTEGVPDQLRDIIDELTAPNPTNRPANAAAVVTRIDHVLAPKKKVDQPKEKTPPKRGRWAIVTVGAVVLALAGSWFSGALDGVLEPPLPVAQPYMLEMVAAEGAAPILTGNAPDTDTAQIFRTTVSTQFGSPPQGNIVLATGMPTATWDAEARALIEATAALDSVQLSISDKMASVAGLAANIRVRAMVKYTLDAFAAEFEWDISTDIAAGPLVLGSDTVSDTVRPMTDCGRLTVDGATDGQFGITDHVTITGNIADPNTQSAIEDTLAPIVGDRAVAFSTQILSPGHCMIRQRLADVPNDVGSLALSDGDTGARNLSGVFRVGQNPVIDLLLPGDLGDGAIWAFFVDAKEKVSGVIPNVIDDRVLVSQRSDLQDGLHRVRILHTVAEFLEDNRHLATRVTSESLGKSEVFVILSQNPLFEVSRPRSESPGAIVQAIDELMAEDPNNIIGFTSVIVDGRP